MLTDKELRDGVQLIVSYLFGETEPKFTVFMDTVEDDDSSFLRFPISYNHSTLYIGKYYSRKKWEATISLLVALLFTDYDAELTETAADIKRALSEAIHQIMVMVARTRSLAEDETEVMHAALTTIIDGAMGLSVEMED